MKSAELKVLSAELEDHPQGVGYQPFPDNKIPPTRDGANTYVQKY